MKLQRIICIMLLAASVLAFLYALGYMTDVYDMIYKLRDSKKTPEIKQFLSDMDLFNRDLVRAGIGMILVSLTLFLTNTHIRRKYYVGNYAATALSAGAAIAFSAWAHNLIADFKAQYLSGIIDFEEVKAWADRRTQEGGTSVYTDSTFWFDIHYLVFGILLLAAILLILNAIWKSMLMKREKNALSATEEV